jgi:hypothetical protein
MGREINFTFPGGLRLEHVQIVRPQEKLRSYERSIERGATRPSPEVAGAIRDAARGGSLSLRAASLAPRHKSPVVVRWSPFTFDGRVVGPPRRHVGAVVFLGCTQSAFAPLIRTFSDVHPPPDWISRGRCVVYPRGLIARNRSICIESQIDHRSATSGGDTRIHR